MQCNISGKKVKGPKDHFNWVVFLLNRDMQEFPKQVQLFSSKKK